MAVEQYRNKMIIRMMKMKKKNIFIRLLIFIILLIGVTAALILKNKEWFFETVSYYAESGGSGYRNEEDVIEETYSTTGRKRYREGDLVFTNGTWFCLCEGVSLDIDMNVTVKKGSFKVVIYELGKEFNIQGKSPEQYLSEDKKVHEEEYTETGTYQMDFPMLQPDKTYMLIWLEPLGEDVAYSYNYTEHIHVKRWQYLYDSYIGSLPFFKPKYGGNVDLN